MFSGTVYMRKSCLTVDKRALNLDYRQHNYKLRNKILEIQNMEQKGGVLSVKYE